MFTLTALPFLIIAFNIFSSPKSHASVDQIFIKQLNFAKNQAQVERLQESYQLLKISREACKRQLQRSDIPTACYEALYLEHKWGLSDSKTTDIRAKLDTLCKQSSMTHRFLEKMTPQANQTSRNCQRSVAIAEKIKRYRLAPRATPATDQLVQFLK